KPDTGRPQRQPGGATCCATPALHGRKRRPSATGRTPRHRPAERPGQGGGGRVAATTVGCGGAATRPPPTARNERRALAARVLEPPDQSRPAGLQRRHPAGGGLELGRQAGGLGADVLDVVVDDELSGVLVV